MTSKNTLQSRLDYVFCRPVLLRRAMTHRSHSAPHNEKFEFLGDAVLNCVISALIFQRFPALKEGDLSRIRAHLVKQQTLCQIAQTLELAKDLRLGEGELRSGGRKRPSMLADALEALFGAIYLDGGFSAARAAIERLYAPILDHLDLKMSGKDAKTCLQELLQGRKIALPEYTVITTRGAAHRQQFEIQCTVPSLEIQARGRGASRRAAEQEAAARALAEIKRS
ncbi:Ribonuclease III (RNase III) [Candidatus Glomeribacter gigasporarum BEG34]|uniref:Ribonuclease 3 n=1 Tax=Candidatus Glomeribacter gigasporarum BEG34 TaxID=1070319 RepID=G2J7C7_9BURK|nr:Ribonuclease III (RNase III) [Candidatus Glomeribacter gigasporarum BEG34]